MTKLGLQPAVHGDHDEKEKEEKDHIKIDPKVFTVLQPTVIPMPVVQDSKRSSFNCSELFCKAVMVLCLFTCFLTAVFLLLSVTQMLFNESSIESPEKPSALLGNNQQQSKQIDSSVEGKNTDEIVAIPLARVMVVEDISSNPDKKTKIIDGSVEDRSQQQQQFQFQFQQPQPQQQRPLHPDEIEMLQRQAQEQQMIMYQQQLMAMRQWRMRRLQAALYQQQQQMQLAQQQEEWARQQWAQRSRIEEERRQWEMMAIIQQQQQQQQQQQRNQAYWQQYQAEIEQQQQQRPIYWQQQQQFQPQPQPQQFFPQIMQQLNQEQQFQRPSVWQQPPQTFFFQPRVVDEPAQHDKIYEELQKKSQNIETTRPVEMNQPPPQPSMHDKIYEELQKKSQIIPVNAPSRQIWTAITPSPVVEELPSTQAPVPVDDVSDTILRDIFSAFDEQKNSEAATKEIPTSTTPSTPSTTQQPETIVEGKGAVVIEDSFPRIEERTTTPETEEESDEIVDDHEKENDEFVSVMKFFENAPIRHSEPAVASTIPLPVTTEKPLPIFL